MLIKGQKPIILHIDMDAFFVSVECLLDPSLKGKAVVVGSDHARGVVAAASYEARKYGVFSAMSCVKAKQLCPHLTFVYSGREYYSSVSKHIMSIIRSFSPLVEVMGLDEAYLDATGMENFYQNPYAMAKEIQEKIFNDTNGLTASIGIAPLKFLAKIASDMNKPHGIYEVKEEEVDDFLKNMDLYKIPHVGKKFLQSLHALGIRTAGEAKNYSKDFFERRFGKQGILLYERVNGIDNTPIVPYHEPKSESAELTLEEDITDKAQLKEYLKMHSERIGKGLRKMEKKASTVTLKLKFSDFTQITRQLSLSTPTCSAKTLYEAGVHLLEKEDLPRPVRLIGLGASQFDAKEKIIQGSLIEEINTKNLSFDSDKFTEMQREKLEKTLDSIQAKYGNHIVKN